MKPETPQRFRWESTYLDQDGGTKDIERRLEEGRNIFQDCRVAYESTRT